jgi:hypothetical protein
MKLSELLTDASRWTKNHYAIDTEGRPVQSRSPQAARWCLSGAICRCYSTQDERLTAEEALREAAGTLDIVAWNDAFERTFADVRALIERAGV